MHFHAYSFHGQGEAVLLYDVARTPGGEGFETSLVPPAQTSAWLRKPARMIKGTWDDPAGAVAWLRDRYAEIAGSILRPELSTRAPDVDARAGTALERLARGNDVVWAWWLTGGMYVNLTVVCCPNREGDIPCPTGRSVRP